MARLISYQNKDTAIHRLSGLTKLVFFLLWCMMSALTFDTRVLAVMILAGIVITIVSRTEWKQVSKVVCAVAFFMIINLICIFLFSPMQGCELYGSRTELFRLSDRYIVTREQLFYEFNVLLKYFTVVPAVFIFMVTTDPSELAASMNRVGVPYTLAYSVAIALRYIPDVQGDFRRIRNAQEARGVEMSRRENLIKRLTRTASIISPLLFSTMDRIDVVSNAMELRGFGKHRKRTWYSARQLTGSDTRVLVLIIAAFILSIVVTYADGNRYYYPW